MSFAGKFFFHSAPEYYQFGVVKEQFQGIILIQLWSSDKPELKAALTAVSIADVVEDLGPDGFIGDWFFFDTEKELRDYLAWVDRLAEEGDAKRPKVVLIKK